VTKTSNTYYSTLDSRSAVSLERSINCDSGTEQRRNFMETIMEPLGNFEGPMVVDLNMGTVSTEILSVKVNTVFAHLSTFLFVFAILASQV